MSGVIVNVIELALGDIVESLVDRDCVCKIGDIGTIVAFSTLSGNDVIHVKWNRTGAIKGIWKEGWPSRINFLRRVAMIEMTVDADTSTEYVSRFSSAASRFISRYRSYWLWSGRSRFIDYVRTST